MVTLEIAAEDWPVGDWSALAERAAGALVRYEPALHHPRLFVSLVFTTDAQVHAMNREWRGRDRATNVLSFPMLEHSDLVALSPDGPPELIGDIALAYGVCAREAAEEGIPVADHAAHLIVHGLLHLAGYDHETSDADADAMEAIEIKVLADMGIANPYDASGATVRES